jgi:hypothetical protein
MADQTAAPPSSATPKTAWATIGGIARRFSLSRIQAVVATLAGITSLVGGVFSVVQFAGPGKTGALVATVQAADSRAVTDATVEVLTVENALVATLKPDSAGQVTRELNEGVYVVRVSHPRYAAEVRRIQVQPQQTIEVKTTLRSGSSSPAERAARKGVGAVRRALGF